MNKLLAFISLTRPLNAAITFAGVAAAGYIAGAHASDIPLLVTASTAGMLLTGAGNCLNDVFDVDIDRINKPHRSIAAGLVTEREAQTLSLLLTVAGLLLSPVCGAVPFLVAAAATILMYAYNASLKHIPLVGNFTVGVLTALTFIYGASVVSNPIYGLIPAVFALLMNFAREILKDIEDMPGDEAVGIVTYPLHAGIPAALALVTTVLLATMAAALLPFFFHVYSETYLWTVLAGVHSVLIFVISSMWRSSSPVHIGRLSVVLKYDMIVGLMALVLGSR